MIDIKLIKRRPYGQFRYYPGNPAARAFALMLEVKSFSQKHYDIFEAMQSIGMRILLVDETDQFDKNLRPIQYNLKKEKQDE